MHIRNMRVAAVAAAVCFAGLSALALPAEERFNGQRYMGASGDWLSVSLQGYEEAECPAVYAKGKGTVVIRNEVPRFKNFAYGGECWFELSGTLTVRILDYTGKELCVLGRKEVKSLRHRQSVTFPIDFEKLGPGAYVVTAELPPHVWADRVYNPKNTASGITGMPMLYGRNAMRLAVFKDIPPAKMFGVGNGMVHHGSLWNGMSISNDLEVAALVRPAGVKGTDAFHNAIVGAPGHDTIIIDVGADKSIPDMCNPLKNVLDVYSPTGRAELVRRGEKTGRRYAKDANMASFAMNGEVVYFNRGTPCCPSKWADADFREFCRNRYKGDLAAANRAWGRHYASWDAVTQPVYEVPSATNVIVKTDGAAIDWTANLGNISKEYKEYLKKPEVVPFAMDWYRWRAKTAVDILVTYANAAKKYDRKTIYTNQYCWPNIFTFVTLPAWRRLDAAGLDCQYLSRFPRVMGNDAEMIEILEQAESVMEPLGKPIIGYEMYIQPTYTANAAACQNWALVAHGMSLNLVFGYKTHCDYAAGAKLIREGVTRIWERPGWKLPMWGIIDVDGTKLPAYYGVKRSTEEIAAYHEKYDGFSIKRIRGRNAIYLSTDTANYMMLSTGDEPYNSKLCSARWELADQLRIAGVRIEYFDDETIGQVTTRDYDTLIIPPSPYVDAEAAKKIDAYEKAGGKVIRLDDVTAAEYDVPGGKPVKEFDWASGFLAAHPEVKRSAWWRKETGRGDVEVVVRRQVKTGKRFVFVLNRRDEATRGTLTGPDFEGVAKLTDVNSGREEGLAFELPSFGYRVFEM